MKSESGRFAALVVSSLTIAWTCVEVGCGRASVDTAADAESPVTDTDATTSPDASVLPSDGSSPSASCPSSYPICNAFKNDGSRGGSVSVSIDAQANVAKVTTKGLAAHAMGPYGSNPNTATARELTLTIPLVPTEAAGGAAAGFGHVAIAWDGVAIYNPTDARDLGGCTGNAAYLEADGVDAFGGHPAPSGEYHYHTGAFLTRAAELGLKQEEGSHSSLVGYAFDGVPIYGSYGYSDPTDATSAIKRVTSCYRLKAERTCCADPSKCALVATFDRKPLVMGAFVEDFELDQDALAAGTCDLDAFNSRFAKTPEYPEGTRVYVMTLDESGVPTYPFVFGTRYWGSPAQNPR